MASLDFEKIIKDFSSYFGVPMSNLTFTFDNRIPVVKLQNKNETLEGLRNIISVLHSQNDAELNVIQDQWIEYVLVNLKNFDSHIILKELNEYIADKVYFVGYNLSPVDILIYYLVYGEMFRLTFQEKEKYIHVSRWFNNIQQNEKVRLERSVVPFSRISLYAY